MFKYFDTTFFKFLFGFIAILAVSFALLLAIRYFGGEKDLPPASYVEAQSSKNQN